MAEKFLKKKSLGQNFLRSEKALSQIVEAGCVQSGDNIIEIGPGDGALTAKILGKMTLEGGIEAKKGDKVGDKVAIAKKITTASAGKLFLVEKDDRLVPILEEKFGISRIGSEVDTKKPQITLIHKDILEVFEHGDIDNMIKNGALSRDFKIIANIPYYITGAIVRRIFELQNTPKIVVLLVQKEVADRIVDTRESLLSVSVKFYGRPKRVAVVPKGAFSPAPTVDSAIISIDNIHKPESPELERAFFAVVKSAFAHKRKLLIRNLEAVNLEAAERDLDDKNPTQTQTQTLKFTNEKLQEIFTEQNINLKARAEDISTEQYIAIAKHLV